MRLASQILLAPRNIKIAYVKASILACANDIDLNCMELDFGKYVTRTIDGFAGSGWLYTATQMRDWLNTRNLDGKSLNRLLCFCLDNSKHRFDRINKNLTRYIACEKVVSAFDAPKKLTKRQKKMSDYLLRLEKKEDSLWR